MKTKSINQYILVYSLFIIGILSTSCTSQVEIDAPTDRIDHSEVYKDIGTTKAALNSLYLDLELSAIFNKASSGVSFNMSLFTDELDFYGTSSIIKDIYENNFTDNNSTINSWWNNSYQNIYRINAFIEGVNGSPVLGIDLKKSLLGEAYTLRALYYHYLVILFGDVAYTTSTDYNINQNLKRLPYQEVLLKIESDLKEAIQLLDYSYRDPNRFYINKAIAEVILIENYIIQEKFNEAEKVAHQIIDKDLFQIEDDLSKTFKNQAQSTIWQIAPRYASRITSEASLYLFSNFTISSATISNNLLELFDNKDNRKKDWLNKISINNQEFYQVYKYKTQANNTDEYSIFYRIEQVYFHLAYSLAMQGNIEKAIESLNVVRHKRGLDNLPSNLNQQQFITNYLEESSREFFTENARRFIDLKITNTLNDLKLIKTNFQPHHNLLPIPFRQMEINKNLRPNNPGY
ncbi:RagB/SusD family nutrient uptake outer membrane protein [Myroides pelagicus]|uniref:RagB/SusD family nutrient uptake outer membrane protein n=1 Tax=Myroides pelagicus TaxID=270914 RepID=UPI002DB5A6F2|nr:RagB/SusD family nutrient uptake outer membrane protein [Myroides pelagicus]MEC4115092.1 RagB/SusD family nutrient uptake outer membrane protein [Myroides pelagicus]